MKFIFVLGAADPEMEAIEKLLEQQRVAFTYALAPVGEQRVHAPDAYRARVSDPEDLQWARARGVLLVTVECAGPAIRPVDFVIDHHKEGDVGYGRGPEDAVAASSIGQVYALLGLDMPQEARVVAAADHCLQHAYAGRVPGVTADEVLAFRVASRCAFQGISPKALKASIDETTAALAAADVVSLAPGIVVADMRREPPFPELPEAACRLGTAYISGPLRQRDGREKFTVSGPPEAVRAFLDVWAPAQGLTGAYGDPARNFGGAYRAK